MYVLQTRRTYLSSKASNSRSVHNLNIPVSVVELQRKMDSISKIIEANMNGNKRMGENSLQLTQVSNMSSKLDGSFHFVEGNYNFNKTYFQENEMSRNSINNSFVGDKNETTHCQRDDNTVL